MENHDDDINLDNNYLINLYQKLIEINAGMNDNDSNSDSLSVNNSFDYFDGDWDLGFGSEDFSGEEYMEDSDYENMSDTSTVQDDEEESTNESSTDSDSDEEFIPNEEVVPPAVVAGAAAEAEDQPAIIEPIFVQRTPRTPPAVPPAQEEAVLDQENVVHSQKKIKLDESLKEKKVASLEDDSDEDQRCSICLEVWSNAGEHRLCSLRCGHLFGLNCIEQWFAMVTNAAARKCPECNTKASRKDIRIIYAKSLLKCIDTSEIEKLKKEMKEVTTKKDCVERELQLCKSKETLYEQRIKSLNLKIIDLEKTLKAVISEKNNLNLQYDNIVLKSKKLFDICNNDSCRVIAYNPWHNILVASSGNSFTRIMMDTLSSAPSCNIHSDSVRDMAFQEQHPNCLLSVGLDSKVILTDIRNNLLIHSYQEATKLWSCCWSNHSVQTFFVGGAKGNVSEYDIRNLQKSVATKENSEDRSPVVALASIPKTNEALRAGGYIACHLNSCYVYGFKEGNYVGNRINIEGPFTSLRYNEKDNHLLLSCRPSTKNQNVRHVVCSIEKCDDQIKFNTVHTFNAGSLQKLLSRPCYINSKDDTMVVAYNESIKKMVAWSITTGREIYSMPISEPVLDICCFENDVLYQAVLTKNKLHLYNHTSTT